MLIQAEIHNLINGVSQQSPTLRLGSQCEVQINAIGTVVDGLTTRGPLRHISQLNDEYLGSGTDYVKYDEGLVHFISRGDEERYVVIVDNLGVLRVWDLDGEEQTVFTQKKYFVRYDAGTNMELIPEAILDAAGLPDVYAVLGDTAAPTATAAILRHVEGPSGAAGSQTGVLEVGTWNGSLGDIETAWGDNAAMTAYSSPTYATFTLDGGVTPYPNYLSCSGDAKDSMRAVTINDYTFLLNRETVVAMNEQFTPATHTPQAVVHIKQGIKQAEYYIKITEGGNTYEVSHWSGTSEVQPTKWSCGEHAEELAARLDALVYPAGHATDHFRDHWTVTQSNSIIHIIKDDGGDFDIIVEDDYGEQGMSVTKDSSHRYVDLTRNCVHGVHVEITSDDDTAVDDYWVRFEGTDPTLSTIQGGRWFECAEPVLMNELEQATMPHVLVRCADGTFTFRPGAWTPRDAGDDETIPQPSFVGRNISSIFFWRNRLGLLTADNVILSEAAEVFNMWPTTAMTMLDSDPIDVGTGGAHAASLVAAVPFDDDLILFANRQQFVMTGGDLLTPETAEILETTAYAMDTAIIPVATGRSIFFGATRGTSAAAVMEYFLADDTLQHTAVDVTQHVPTYLTSLQNIVASPMDNMIAVHPFHSAGEVFIYKYYWRGQGKIQAAWSKLKFNDASNTVGIIGIQFVDDQLFVVGRVGTSIHLFSMDLNTGAADVHLEHQVCLDNRIDTESTMGCTVDTAADADPKYIPHAIERTFLDVGEGTTTFEYMPQGSHSLMTIISQPAEAGGPTTELVGSWETVSLGGDLECLTVSVPGNVAAIWVGLPYTMTYEFSPLYIRRTDGQDVEVAVTSGTTQVRNITLDYDKCGEFAVVVTQGGGRSPYTYSFSDTGVDATGQFKVPVLSKNTDVTIEITSDSIYPCGFQAARWEAYHVNRARPL